MKYSAVLLAAFAATALAAPAESLQAQDAALLDTEVPSTEDYVPTEETEDYVPTTTDDYETTTTTDYEGEDSGNESYQPTGESYDQYKEVPQSCYKPGEKSEYGQDLYFAEDAEYVKKYEEYSPVEEIYYPEQIDTSGSYCPISYKAKDNGYKGAYKVAICKSTDGYKSCEDVCHDEYSCKHYKPSEEYVPSDDSEKGCMYKFKVYEADNEEACTYSKDFPIYNPTYYTKNTDCKPAPEKCPPPKYVIKAPEPVKEAPVTPEAPVEAPATPEVPYAPTNETSPSVDAPVQLNSGSAVRASFSALVGIAAVVAFAL